MSVRTRWAAAVSAAVLLLGPLAGCGGDDQADSGDAVESATATPSSASSQSAALGTPIAVADFLRTLAGKMADQSSVHMSIGGSSALRLEADVRYGADAAIRMETSIAGTKVSMVIVEGTLYLRQPNGKYQKIRKGDKTYGSLLTSFQNFGPRNSLKELQAGITKVVKVGQTTIDGEDLTHYTATVDATKVVGSFPQLAGGDSSGTVVDMGIYLDSNGLLRRVEVESGGQPVALTYSDWGKPVDIAAPTGKALQRRP